MTLLGYYAVVVAANAAAFGALYLISLCDHSLDWLGRLIDDRDEIERQGPAPVATATRT